MLRAAFHSLFAIALVAVAGSATAAETQPAREIILPAVSVETVSTIDRSQPRTYVGTVSGAESVAIVARVSGTLWEASFREGGLVEKGDVLFQIEDTVYQAQVDVAKAAIAQCEADYQLAVKEHNRNIELLRTKAISAQSHDNTYATMLLREGKLAEARANLVLAQHNLDQCRIVAPISGRIGQKMYSEGNYVTPEVGVLATIVQYSPIDVRFPMSESEYFRYFHSHDELGNVDIDIVRANGDRYDGGIEVDYVDNQVDRATDTIMVTMKCDNPRDQLLPGGYVQVQVAERYDEAVPAVGTSAVMTDGSSHYVYVIRNDDTVERRSVVAGDIVQRRQAVISGLMPGERVVTGGMNKVRPGDTVRPVLVQNDALAVNGKS